PKPSTAKMQPVRTVGTGRAQQSRTTLCKTRPVRDSMLRAARSRAWRLLRGLASRWRGRRGVDPIRLEPRDQGLVRLAPNDLVELRPVVRHQTDSLDVDVVHLPAVAGVVHLVVEWHLAAV